MTLERGTLLNRRYRIAEILGQGGMASIYRAIDENLGVEVAVKENLFTTDEYAAQFRREAVILATLRHTNLPRVTDHFVIQGQGQYLVMDYIEGEDLRQRMDRLGVLTEEEAIVLGVSICDALTYLHSLSPAVLHRDIKPGNVKITPQGQVFLVDFGLAKVIHGKSATESGARAMTPGYSPPEQYGTARTDQRSDIYSLGATLYSALTDNLPEDALARAMDQTRLTSIHQRNPKISRRLESVIEKALAVRPDDRYQSAEEFKQDLLNARTPSKRRAPIDLNLSPPPNSSISDPSVEGEAPQEEIAAGKSNKPFPISTPVQNPPQLPFKQPRSKRHKGGWIAFSFVGLLLFGSILTYFTIPSIHAQVTGWITTTIKAVPVDNDGRTPNPVSFVNKTPTGFVATRPVSTATLQAVFTKTPTHLPSPSMTPTLTSTLVGGGKGLIAFASDRSGTLETWVANIDGTGLRQVTDMPEGACQPSWSPDASRLVFISPCAGNQDIYKGSGLFLINADGTQMTPVPGAPGGDFDPAWSPDGKHIAFTSLRSGVYYQIYIYNLEDHSVNAIVDSEVRDNSQPAWSPDGREIAYVGPGPQNQIWAMAADGSNRRLISRLSGEFKNSNPAWSPDGNMIVFTQWQEGLSGAPWLASAQAKEPSVTVIIERGTPMTEASFSPDGFWMVYEGWPDSPFHHIFMMMPNGVGKQQITFGDANDFDPSWSMDGKKP